MISSTPHMIVGPLTEVGAGAALKAAAEKFGPLEAEVTRNGQERVWLLLYWPKAVPDSDTQLKVLGFCHGVAWAHDNSPDGC